MTKTSTRHYDFIVIGAGLSGLAIAKRLSMENAKVLLVEGQDSIGGTNHGTFFGTVAQPDGAKASTGVMMNNGLRLLPDTAETRGAIEFLASLLNTNLSLSQVESSPMTYESGSLRPFVGFGEKAPPFFHQIASFLNASRLETEPQPWAWCAALAENAPFELMTKSFVTRFNFADEKTPDKITSVTLNGQKEFSADQYIFTGSASLMKALLPNELWTAKAKAKFSKLKLWTQVGLDFVHATTVYDSNNLLILDGTTKDDLGPCVGVFQNHNVSQWMTFLEDDEAEDSEILGQSLKKIRRQIKRAFPEAFENLVFERICIFPSMSATLPSGSFLPEFENLHYGNGQLSPHQGLVGSLLQAQSVLRTLGFASAAVLQPDQRDFGSDSDSELIEAQL